MTEKTANSKCIVVVRIRGTISARREVRATLRMLHLTRNNYAVVIDDRSSFHGMLKSVQSYVTWGEASKETVHKLIDKRGRLEGNKKLAEEYLHKAGFKSTEDLAESICSCHTDYWKLPSIQPVFKLRPPTKGFKRNIKKSYVGGGELGNRREKINELVKRMI